jgi:acetyl-CoA acetyltransferase family protein
MANTAENIAKERGISRETQDEYAALSQKRAAAAKARGVFEKEIIPVEVPAGKGTIVFKEDDHMKPDTTMAGLAKLPPAFGKDGTVTAGNASGIVDGAAALVIMEEEAARAKGLKPRARILGWDVVGVPPAFMGIGPVPAIRGALKKAGLSLRDLDLVEVNEAFSGQYLAVEKDLGLDRDRTNVNGGAIALGHPLAATGTRLLLTLVYELQRRGGGKGAASACIGGGQGIAMIVETIQ